MSKNSFNFNILFISFWRSFYPLKRDHS